MTEASLLPEIRIKWIRGPEHISFKRPHTFLVVGQRGTGKSSLLESIATRYSKVIDLFGSKDNEGLAWCKKESPFKNILLIRGQTVKVASQWDTIRIGDVKLADFEKYEVIVTVHGFYNNSNEYFAALQRITNLLWEHRVFWADPWFVLIREAANWIYSRLQIVRDTQLAKADFIQTLREARHSGLAVGVDTIRWTNIDKEVRDISDFIWIKRVGAIGLPKDLRFLYRYVQPFSLMQASPEMFVLLTSQGNIGYGSFQYPDWHKEEKENILVKLGIEVEYEEGEMKGLGYAVGTMEHAKIVKAYVEMKSMRKAAKEVNRSINTVHQHIKEHNDKVRRDGSCSECANNKSVFAKEIIKKSRAQV